MTQSRFAGQLFQVTDMIASSYLRYHPVIDLLLRHDGDWWASESDPFWDRNHRSIIELEKRGLIRHRSDSGMGAFERLTLTGEGRIVLGLSRPAPIWRLIADLVCRQKRAGTREQQNLSS